MVHMIAEKRKVSILDTLSCHFGLKRHNKTYATKTRQRITTAEISFIGTPDSTNPPAMTKINVEDLRDKNYRSKIKVSVKSLGLNYTACN